MCEQHQPANFFKDLSWVDESAVSEVIEPVAQDAADAGSVLFLAVNWCRTLLTDSGGTHEMIRRSHFAVLQRFH